MNIMAKKIMVYSLAGMMQLGLGATVIEASPLHIDDSQRLVQLNAGHYDHDKWRHQENERHEREMRRHQHESEREWHERQQRENQRHEHERREYEHHHPGFHW